MKPGHTAGPGNCSRKGKHGKPKKVGTAHNKDKGWRKRQTERDITAETRRHTLSGPPELEGGPLNDPEKHAYRKGISVEAIRRAREANKRAGVDTSGFKLTRKRR